VRGGKWQQGVTGFSAVYRAYLQCRRRKRATPQAQFYEAHLLDNLMETVQALESGSWRPGRPVCFMVDKPKAREIHAARYSDRVVHHLLVPRLEELYEPVFIHDVYSNRESKGTHLAVKRLQYFMRGVRRTDAGRWFPGSSSTADSQASALEPEPSMTATIKYPPLVQSCRLNHLCVTDGSGRCGREQAASLLQRERLDRREADSSYRPTGFFLQLDIRNFFNSIDRAILYRLLQKRLRKGVKQKKISEENAVFYRELSHTILKQEVGKESLLLSGRAEAARVPAHKRLVNAGVNKGLPIGNLTSQFFANVYLNELDQFIKHTLKCRRYLRYVDDFVLLHNDQNQLKQWEKEIEFFLKTHLALKLKEPRILQPIHHGIDFLGYIVRPDYILIRRRVVGNLREKLMRFQHQWVKGNTGKGWTITLLPEPRDHLRSVLASYMGHFKHGCHYKLVQGIFTRFPWLTCLFALLNDRLIPLWQPLSVSSFKSQQRFFRRLFPGAEIFIQCGCYYERFEGIKRSEFPRDNPIFSVSRVIVRQQGYLKGGLRRRCVESISLPPTSTTGVVLCKKVSR